MPAAELNIQSALPLCHRGGAKIAEFNENFKLQPTFYAILTKNR